MTKNIAEKHRYTVIDGKLCIQHYLLLQQLTYHKKLKDDTYKEYQSYHIKLPRAVKELLVEDTVFLEKKGNKLVLHTCNGDGFKKIKIQESRKGNKDKGYQLTIPQKLLDMTDYKRGATYILCQISSSDNDEGFVVSLELVGE